MKEDERGRAAAERFAAVWGELERELDWQALGRAFCSEGGEDFFGPEERAALLDTGLLFADDLSRALRRGGRSLWIGASVAELVPLLVEHLCLGREVLWHELDGPVTRELSRGLERVGQRLGLVLPRPDLGGTTDTEPAPGPGGLSSVPSGSCDHVWLVSVLSDPEHFPALHDRLYERTGELATGRGNLARDTLRAKALAAEALRCLRLPGRLTTTDEELVILGPLCERKGVRTRVSRAGRLSAVVGDVVRGVRVERASRGR